MKSATTKNSQPSVVSPKPFFNKGGEDSFFSKGSETDSSFFSSSNIQANLAVGAPDDPFEQEAEKVSRQVMEGFDTANSVQRKIASMGVQPMLIQPMSFGTRISRRLQKNQQAVQAKCTDCEKEDKLAQPKSLGIQFFGDGAMVPTDIESKIQSKRGSGSGMDAQTLSVMESSFGADFSGVRVHTDSHAVQMSQQLNAHAFTVGNDIFFNQGRYQPSSKEGAGLLAHELTHTVQQGASVQNKRINRQSLLSSLSNHTMAHLSAMNGTESAGLSRKEITQLQQLSEEEMNKGQQLQMLQMKGVDEVQKKENVGMLRRCNGSTATPKLKKTTVAGPTSGNCGGFNWGAQWSIDNATASTDGWIVQKVNSIFDVKDCTDAPVDIKTKTAGRIDPSWYPFWEAWQVRGGNVFVGGGSSSHTADTYGSAGFGDSTKGSRQITGKAEFFPGATLPSHFTPRNAPPAMSLPYTQTDPALTGGTGAINHNLTATWNCCQPDKSTTVTTA